jgi:hypothetical protein
MNGTQHMRDTKSGLFATMDKLPCKAPTGWRYQWKKTNVPATSPKIGTPAFAAYASREQVWAPVLVPAR